MTIQMVVFDMAGTTVRDDGAVNGCLRAALAAAGLDLTATDVNTVMGLPKPESIRRLLASSPRAAELRDRVDVIHTDFVRRMRHFYATDTAITEMPHATATFALLRARGIKVALDTGFSRDIAQIVLDRLGWVGASALVDGSVTSDEVPRGRPHPDMIRHLMARFGVTDPLRVAKVGDTPVDLEEGTNAGCGLVIGVTNGTHIREQLAGYPHTHLIPSLLELPALLG